METNHMMQSVNQLVKLPIEASAVEEGPKSTIKTTFLYKNGPKSISLTNAHLLVNSNI